MYPVRAAPAMFASGLLNCMIEKKNLCNSQVSHVCISLHLLNLYNNKYCGDLTVVQQMVQVSVKYYNVVYNVCETYYHKMRDKLQNFISKL